MSGKKNEVAILLSLKDLASKELSRFGGRAKRGLSSIRKSVFSLRGAFAALGSGLAFRAILNNTVEAEASLKQVEQAIKSTGGAAGLSAKDLADMASRLQDVTTFGDEAILRVQSKILTFTGITKKTFGATTEAVLDLATRMQGDLNGAVVQLGKVLNDPIANLGSLSRVGIQFTETDKAMIKSLAKSGDLLGAQKIILKELNTEFGGSARAARDTFGGALAGLKNKFTDLLEAKGGLKDAQTELEGLTATLGDPEFVANANIITSALIRGFTAVAGITRPVADQITRIKTIASGFAALSLGQISFTQLATSSNAELRATLDALNPVVEQHTAVIQQETAAIEMSVSAKGQDADAVRELLNVKKSSILLGASEAVQTALSAKATGRFSQFVMLATKAQLQETRIILQETAAKQRQTIATLEASRAKALESGEIQKAAGILQQIIAAENGSSQTARRLRQVTEQLANANRRTASSYINLLGTLRNVAGGFRQVASAAKAAGSAQSSASGRGGVGSAGGHGSLGFTAFKGQFLDELQKNGRKAAFALLDRIQKQAFGPTLDMFGGSVSQSGLGELEKINRDAIIKLRREAEAIANKALGVQIILNSQVSDKQITRVINDEIRNRSSDIMQSLRDSGLNPVSEIT